MKKYIDPILHWWWLIILCTLIAGVTCYLSVRNLPPIYEVHATLIVGSSLNKANPNSSEFYLEQQLASVYATIGSQGQLSEPTMKALELESLPKYYISPIPNSALIDIVVSDTDPARAQAVANELARQLIKTSPSGDAAQSEQRQSFINEQLDKMQAEIKATDEQIVEQNELLGQANSARKIADIQRQISALEQKRNTLQANYTNLLANTEEGAPNSLSIVQEASLPTQPVGPNKLLYMALASVLGLFLSTGSAYVIELLDTGIKTKEEVEAIFNAPVLGELPSFPKSEAALYTARNPRSPITDAFRSLRTNLEFMGINEPMRTLLITGPDLSIGKTTVASNLALMFAQGDKKVILVDADLRRPALGAIFGLSHGFGVSDVCVGRADLFNSLVSWNNTVSSSDGDEKKRPFLKQIDLLKILPAGTLPPNPAELLSSARFEQILEELTHHADLVIIDSPPLFLPDTSVLFPKVDGILMVVQLGKIKKNTINLAKEQIKRSGAKLLGVAINRTRFANNPYSYRYEPTTEQPAKTEKPKLKIRFPEMKFLKQR